ncbi:2-keto-3-deoxy-phosphogalactonate aldolase [Tahibacter aquaticus]|uniref:2-keto-3-deoxy-phosphogalactonate aldolase n=1 Tax=Tahibacter aquaticus TaxID=520092 RepID=A0A4R6Z9T5_9GAMM|nr:2-dehydro-3-deoxy-6-phosphogalactonate aldolase [Tahibacter aquaticus]TDR48419.1 2-keto-3-deoxy-phosphogalactonate aldolase [Tahibacter aquaticus]
MAGQALTVQARLSMLARSPIVAILRGLTPDRAVEVAAALLDAGIGTIEVPLNSPDALHSIRLLSERYGEHALIGAGTVLDAGEVAAVAAAGGQLIVSPNTDRGVIAASCAAGLVCLPGVFTPSEAFQALAAGAHGLKLFPADVLGPAGLRALRAVLPAATRVFAVGGVCSTNLADWRTAGADGVGIGATLFRPGMDGAGIRRTAQELVRAWAAASA